MGVFTGRLIPVFRVFFIVILFKYQDMRTVVIALCLLAGLQSAAQQKKPIDHTVYDGWRSLAERMISNDGQFIVYSINPQEGDGVLVIRQFSSNNMKIIPRGNSAVITEDSRFVIAKIKPVFQETRQAKIKKKKPDDMVKDSLAIIIPASRSARCRGRRSSTARRQARAHPRGRGCPCGACGRRACT